MKGAPLFLLSLVAVTINHRLAGSLSCEGSMVPPMVLSFLGFFIEREREEEVERLVFDGRP